MFVTVSDCERLMSVMFRLNPT